MLFLDEVGEMSPPVQAKLLRVLQEREFQRLGGTRVQKADVRVIAATNRDLAAALASRPVPRGPLLPPERLRDPRCRRCASGGRTSCRSPRRSSRSIGRDVGRPCRRDLEGGPRRALTYAWPGNVRELRNAIERAIILCDGGLISAEHLPPAGSRKRARAIGGRRAGSEPRSGRARAGRERAADARNNKAKAARLLGITRAQLYSRLQKYGIV